jgi:hypothetical protein
MPAYNKNLPYWARRPAFGSDRKEVAPPVLSKSTARILHFEYLAGLMTLFVGVMGQYMMASNMFSPHSHFLILVPIFAVVFQIPVFAVLLPVFCNQPLIPFPTYVRWCLYMSCCSVASALLFEFYHAFGLLPVRNATLFIIARIAMHLGWISFVPQIHYWFLRRKAHAS